MNFPCKLVSAALLALAGLSPVHAIVVNSAFGAAEAAIYGSDIQFGGVVRINIAGTGICTGTLISASTILTAKHCTAALASEITVDFDLNGNGILESGVDQTNAISSIYRAPDAPGNPNLIDGTDVAMLTLSGLLPSWANALFQKLWDGSLLDSLVTMVGYGGQGVNALATNPGLSRWAAENTVDKVGAAGFNQPNSANIISTDFDNPVGQGFPPLGFGNTLGASPINSSPVALFAEGTTAGGDSGGPLFVEVDGVWLVAGVLSGGTSSSSSFGDISWWTGLGDYRSEIEARGGVFYSNVAESTVPEPGAWGLILLATFTAGAFGKRREVN
jgi:hypothetical protein